jgi:hypothetical protein
MAGEHDAQAWLREPLTAAEGGLAAAAEWGPPEDWADWTDPTPEAWFSATTGR